jgi:hypothetical protein
VARPARAILDVMAAAESRSEGATFGGELWTDASGSAAVELAPYLRDRAVAYTYEIRPLKALGHGSVAAELIDGRLLIRSDAPHLKVEWRVTAWPRRQADAAR